ncbi:MAG: hypothetical protein A2898_03890 [Candidatus Kerfeldbacteria bacterium RIFCSPLOWO2_01_FULL_48_11]|uniref:Thioredoxin domain-containing protein n=1 Tax=Candidatus Kerfeldbacteria bacterium RIFCSPLOWO2_01_FULL_48_11 TaxID=1798543 RepID=A0A1G2B6J2_9BACT|nr:MAG: hypothetical protein A2898_03890 [Candidatus Kerfeldbacteria bacterium RIFCSPLOWO2_01_FULL_48_11]
MVLKRSSAVLAGIIVVALAVVAWYGVQVIRTATDDGSQSTIFVDTPPPVTGDDPVLGPGDALVTIVEFSDFQCPACQSMRDTLADVLVRYAGRVRLVWKDFPDTYVHPDALSAAQAARCAQLQDKFWEYHDALFVNQDLLSTELYRQIAQTLELDINEFQACIEGPLPAVVDRTFREGLERKISATPHFFINGQQASGALSAGSLQSLIDQALDEAS